MTAVKERFMKMVTENLTDVPDDEVQDIAQIGHQNDQQQRAQDLGTVHRHHVAHQAEDADGGDVDDHGHDLHEIGRAHV